MTDGDDGTKAAADEGISTTYGDEFATMLIEKRIPFSVTYGIEFQASFHVEECYEHRVFTLLMKLRGSKLR